MVASIKYELLKSFNY